MNPDDVCACWANHKPAKPAEVTANAIIEYPIPVAAMSLLKRVQNGGVPEAIVAGGCLRDTIMGRPVNDIDIFVPENAVEPAQRAIHETHPKCTKSIPKPYFIFNSDVRTVRYYDPKDGVKWPQVNIIAVAGECTPEAQLERFDFGICRVAFDGVRLWKDLGFDRDQRDETFSLLVGQSEEQRKYSLKRFERLLAKYPGWRFVDRYAEKNWFDKY